MLMLKKANRRERKNRRKGYPRLGGDPTLTRSEGSCREAAALPYMLFSHVSPTLYVRRS